MSKIYLHNQQFVESDKASIHPSDLGLIRGYSIFDYFRISGGKALFLDDYLDRFFSSASALRLDMGYSVSALKSKIEELVRLNGVEVAGVRMLLTGGISTDYFNLDTKPNLMVMVEDISFPSIEKYQRGATLISVEFQRWLPYVKSTNYLFPIYSIPDWRDKGAEEILYVHNGKVFEASRSNVFIVKDGVLITNQEGVLRGVTRKKVIELAQKYYKLEIRDFTYAELLAADEVFTTSTTKKIMPIIEVDNHPIKKGQPGGISLHILDLFNNLEKSLMT